MSFLELPSENKLQRLRESGIVPVSKSVLRIAALLLIGVFLLQVEAIWSAAFHDLPEFISHMESFLRRGALSNSEIDAQLGVRLAAIQKLFWLPLALIICCLPLCALLQSKFFFSLGLLSFNAERLDPLQSAGVSGFLKRACAGLAALALFLGLCFFLLRSAVFPLLSLFNAERQVLAAWLPAVFERLAPVLMAVTAIALLAAIGVSRLTFRFRHRMTPEEAAEEALQGD